MNEGTTRQIEVQEKVLDVFRIKNAPITMEYVRTQVQAKHSDITKEELSNALVDLRKSSHIVQLGSSSSYTLGEPEAAKLILDILKEQGKPLKQRELRVRVLVRQSVLCDSRFFAAANLLWNEGRLSFGAPAGEESIITLSAS